jgi:hypothetical protein
MENNICSNRIIVVAMGLVIVLAEALALGVGATSSMYCYRAGPLIILNSRTGPEGCNLKLNPVQNIHDINSVNSIGDNNIILFPFTSLLCFY